MRRIVLVAAAAVLVGCGQVTPTRTPAPTATTGATSAPSFIRYLKPSEGPERRLLIYDPRGLLLAAAVPSDQGATYNVFWKPVAGDPNSLFFEWLGAGRCTIDPTLRVTTDGEDTQGILLALNVFDGHRLALPSGEVCDEGGINSAVVLTFRRPITDFHISVSLTEEPE